MRRKKLSAEFIPSVYELTVRSDGENKTVGQLRIRGKKHGRPSKRFRLNQKGIKVTGATIFNHGRSQDVVVSRVNTLPTFDEVRIHTENTLSAGNYLVDIEFESKLQPDDYRQLFQALSNQDFQVVLRKHFPSVDDAYARERGEYKLSYGGNENEV